jgi:hypothetical protein
MQSLMDLVRDYPATSGAFDDLRVCLDATGDVCVMART